MPNIGPQKMFGLVYETATGMPRRLIDPSDDVDDSYLIEAQRHLKPDETMRLLPIDDFPVRGPFVVARKLGLIL